MDVTKWIQQARELGQSALSNVSSAVGAGAGFVQSAIGISQLFGSTESSESYDGEKVDEKHYFLIPDRRTEIGYSIYVMRCLPKGVPPINDLPKHRLLHLPNEHALPMFEHILLAQAREKAQTGQNNVNSFGGRLHEVADQLDRLDGRVFHGVLLIGGLVALINPLAGAAIAAKGLVPSFGMLLSKYGLQYAGETATTMEMSQRIRTAEKDVLKQFRGAGTETVINPLLTQLDHALETPESEYDPVLDFDSGSLVFGSRGRDRLLQLSCQAIANIYEDTIEHRARWDVAQLGPEDIRFLKLLRDLTEDPGE